MLERIAIRYLRKRKVTILMNVKIMKAKIYELSRKCYLYDNDIVDSVVYDINKKIFNVPKGKFIVEYSNEEGLDDKYRYNFKS